MIRVENDCCGCAVPAYPCLGDSCPLRHQKHYYCDSCGDEVEELYYGISGKELCDDCALGELEVVE